MANYSGVLLTDKRGIRVKPIISEYLPRKLLIATNGIRSYKEFHGVRMDQASAPNLTTPTPFTINKINRRKGGW